MVPRVVEELVRRVEPGAGLLGDLERDGEGHAAERPRLARDDGERLAVDPLHDQEEDALLFAEVEHLGHVGVADPRHGARLVEEHHLGVGVVERLAEHHLRGDDLLEAARALHAGGPHRRGPALRDRHQELVAAEHESGAEILFVHRYPRVTVRGCARP